MGEPLLAFQLSSVIEQIADEVGIGSSALLTVLQDATIDLRDLRGEELTDRAKYAELVMKVNYSPLSLFTEHEPDPSSPCSVYGKSRKPSRRVSKRNNSSLLDYSAISTTSWSRSLQQNGDEDRPTVCLSPTCRFEQSRRFFSKSSRYSKAKSSTNSTRSNQRRTLSSISTSTDWRINRVAEVVPTPEFVLKLSVANLLHLRLVLLEASPHDHRRCLHRSERQHLAVLRVTRLLRMEPLLK